MVGAGPRFLSVDPPEFSSGSDDGISCHNSKFNCHHAMLQDKYSTTLLEELTTWAIVSVTFRFLATRFRATLRGFLGGTGKLASRLVGLSSMRGIWGSPGRLNLDHC
jgi:hypothetical protein